MNDALKNPNMDVPFNTVGDATLTALPTLASIFKNKYNKYNNPPAPQLID
jgi:hypothetical protein